MDFFIELVNWFSKGGVIMWVILAFSIYGMGLCFERWMNYRKQERALSDRWQKISNTSQKAEGDLHAAFNENFAADSLSRIVLLNGVSDIDVRTEKVRCAFLDESARIERHLGIISVVATLLPLLGLLGTIAGMITSFDAIAEHGTGNPRIVADGISVALITTEAGLITAIPLLYLHQILSSRADSLIRKLDEYTTHILHIFVKEG